MPITLGEIIVLASKIKTSQTAVSQREDYAESDARQKIDALLEVFNYPPELVTWWADSGFVDQAWWHTNRCARRGPFG